MLKEREYRLDGLFSPPEQRNDLPAVILEAQMAADLAFLLRLFAELAQFLQQERWPLEWQVVIRPLSGGDQLLQGSLLNLAALAREAEIPRKRAESYLGILEDLLLGYRVPVFQRRAQRQLV